MVEQTQFHTDITAAVAELRLKRRAEEIDMPDGRVLYLRIKKGVIIGYPRNKTNRLEIPQD